MERVAAIRLERELNAPIERVFKALTQGTNVPKWLGPSDDYRVTVHTWDCKPGGKHRVEFNTPEGETHIVVGVFKEVTANQRLSFTWTWEGREVIDSLVTFALTPSGGRTHVLLTHEGFPDQEMRAHHNEGWVGTLERLMRAVG
jgi:uncharacterized protein YndB with AHSA1/START domain